jgi:hypothetical protein
MRVKGSYAPQPFEYEVLGKNALLRFHESVEETNEVDEGTGSAFVGWEFDRYTIERPYDAGLVSRIEGDMAAWLDLAKGEESARLAADVRRRRNEALEASDKTQLADAPLSEGAKAAYRAYRQALRDVPQQPGFPYTVEFPVCGEP